MTQQIREAGIRHAIVRLPEFYGPSVVTLTARIFRAALSCRRAFWPGSIDFPSSSSSCPTPQAHS
jgi:hypothetical protein